MGGKLTSRTSPDSDQDCDEGTQGDGYAVTQDPLCFCVQRDPTFLYTITPDHLSGHTLAVNQPKPNCHSWSVCVLCQA